MGRTPTTARRWVSWAVAWASAWAVRSLSRCRPDSPGWPPDSTADVMITSAVALAALALGLLVAATRSAEAAETATSSGSLSWPHRRRRPAGDVVPEGWSW